MRGNLPDNLLTLLRDRTHGATYIQEKIIDELSALQRFEPSLLVNLAEGLRQSYPAMVQLHHLSSKLEECAEKRENNCVKKLKEFFGEMHNRAVNKCVEEILKLGPSRITTISHSSQVIKVLTRLKKKGHKFTLLVGEGKPAKEGLVTARVLREAGIKSYVCKDGNLAKYARRRDLILTGTDAFGKEWLINKIGSYELVIKGGLAGVPTIVCASEDKRVVPDIMNYSFDTDFLRNFKREITEMQMEVVPTSIVWKLIF